MPGFEMSPAMCAAGVHVKTALNYRDGTDHIGSLLLLCAYCNRIKGDRSQEYLITRQKELVT